MTYNLHQDTENNKIIIKIIFFLNLKLNLLREFLYMKYTCMY